MGTGAAAIWLRGARSDQVGSIGRGGRASLDMKTPSTEAGALGGAAPMPEPLLFMPESQEKSPTPPRAGSATGIELLQLLQLVLAGQSDMIFKGLST
jgi:hypothetical protein